MLYLQYRVFARPRFRTLQEFDYTDVPPNITLLPKVAIFIVYLSQVVFSQVVKSDTNEFSRAQLSARINFR